MSTARYVGNPCGRGKRKGYPTCRINRAAGECMAAFKGSRLGGHAAVIGVSLHENR